MKAELITFGIRHSLEVSCKRNWKKQQLLGTCFQKALLIPTASCNSQLTAQISWSLSPRQHWEHSWLLVREQRASSLQYCCGPDAADGAQHGHDCPGEPTVLRAKPEMQDHWHRGQAHLVGWFSQECITPLKGKGSVRTDQCGWNGRNTVTS